MKRQTEEAPIDVQGVHKSFGKQTVLDGIDLTVRRGEMVAVLGRSGTGKSVLLKVLVGLERPDSGTVRIAGQDIGGLERRELNEVRKKMGFLFQEAALYDSLTVEQNVEFPLDRHTEMSPSERKQRARELLAGVGMDSGLEKLPSQISGGMQKRVGLARALALDPDILLFDEPTAGLDPITATEIGKLISNLKREHKVTAVVVTHDLPAARLFSDRFVLIHDGELVLEGDYEELRRSRNELAVQFLRNGG
jgi:phospholipid/cholesterol/gamma-HCH transport system ATP-binding protein